MRRTVLGVAAATLLLAGAMTISRSVSAAQLREATVTEIVREVNLLQGRTAARPAAVNETVRDGTAVRTGGDSRAELTFSDLTLARLGSNTVFTFDGGTRTIDLSGGAILLQVPKGIGGATISTPAVTAGITGTTVMLEYTKGEPAKFVVLEGTGQLCLTKSPSQCIPVGPGQMALYDGKLSGPYPVDVKKILRTARLLRGFKHKLPSLHLIQLVARQQGGTGAGGGAPPGGTFDAIDQRNNSIAPSPPPTPPIRPPGS